MHINGQPVTSSGVMIVGPGEQGALTLPFGRFDLEFNPTAMPQAARLQTAPPKIILDGTDNALGFATVFSVPTASGSIAMFRLVIYTIGTGAGTYRIVHYTTT